MPRQYLTKAKKKRLANRRVLWLDLSNEEDQQVLFNLVTKSYHKFKTVVDTYGKPI